MQFVLSQKGKLQNLIIDCINCTGFHLFHVVIGGTDPSASTLATRQIIQEPAASVMQRTLAHSLAGHAPQLLQICLQSASVLQLNLRRKQRQLIVSTEKRRSEKEN